MQMSKAAVTVALVASLIEPASAQSKPETTVLFQGVRIFDGKGASLSAPANVLVRGNKIERISTMPIEVARNVGATIVNGDGRTLMPGLIDNHAHLTFWTFPLALMTTADPNYLQVRQAAAAKEFLMAGYTSARDVSGPVFGIKRAKDEGLFPGPASGHPDR